MSSATSSPLPTPGTVVAYHFEPPFIIVSFFVSFSGAITFVELLHRRRKSSGWRYWRHLALTALPLGLVGIWCMHFVGNAAIVLGDGSKRLQPVYSPKFSILSAIIPIVTIVSALWISDKRHGGRKERFAALVAAGVFGGLAIVGMHYTGNLGTTNYRTHADPRTIGGAIAIGCVAMTAVVFGIATLQDSWLNTLKWRIACALVIAVAVLCLHFEASWKLTYIFEQPNQGKGAAQLTNVIVSMILTVMTLFSCGVIALFTAKEVIQIRSKAEQVVLNCAWFDSQGRIMVTRHGILPSCAITTKDNDRGFEQDFDTSHPAFHWLYRVTHDWNSITRFMHGISKHLGSQESQTNVMRPSYLDQPTWGMTPADRQYSVLFRKRFAVAASELAKTLRVGLPELGVLYEGVMSFSTFSRYATHRRSLSWNDKQNPGPIDIESIQDSFGRGQGLFLTKRVDKQDLPKFQTMDFRFLALEKVIVPLAAAMQVPPENARAYMLSVRDKTEPSQRQLAGVRLGLFALCPEADGRLGPKVIVCKREVQRLPSVYLWSEQSQRGYEELVHPFEDMSTTEVLALTKEGRASLNSKYSTFCHILHRSILDLAKLLNDEFFAYATLSTRLFQIPSGRVEGRKSYNSMITFCIIPNVHKSLKYSDDVKLISYNFFRCLQQIRDSPRDPGFVAKVHQEFGMFSDEDDIASPPDTHSSSSLSRISSLLTSASSTKKLLSPKRWHGTPRHSDNVSLNSIETGSKSTLRIGSIETMEEEPDTGAESESFKGGPFGGVLVTRDVTVDQSPRAGIDNISPVSPTSSFPPPQLRTSEFKSVATGQPAEAQTYADELCEITKQRWAKRT